MQTTPQRKIAIALTTAIVAVSVLLPTLAGAEPGFSDLQPMPRALGVAAPLAGPYSAISCPTTSSCTAVATSTAMATVGELTAITETDGVWGTATKLPLPTGADTTAEPGPFVNDVNCSAVGSCTAVGDYLTTKSFQPMVDTETSGTWTSTALVLPTGGKSGVLTKLWCGALGSCIATGYYVPATSSNTFAPMVATETSGVWATATPLTEPVGASIVLPDGMGCTDVGDCVAVGEVFTNSTFTDVYWVETSGVWSHATRFSVAPKTEFIPSGVACPTPGTCLVVGALEGAQGVDPGVATFAGATMSAPSALPEPQLSPTPLSGQFIDISCGSATTCEAVGVFASATSEEPGAATWTSGTWSSVGLLQGLKIHGVASQGSNLTGVSCASSTSCVAIGLDVVVAVVKGSEKVTGEDDFSTAVTPVRTVVAPAAPASVDTTPIVHGVDVKWTPPANDGGSPVVHYTATVAPGGRSCDTAQLQCRITGLTNGQRYVVTVRDVTSYATSGPQTSAPFVAGTAPTPPREIHASASNGRIAVSWHASAVPAPEQVTAYTLTAWQGGDLVGSCRTKQLRCSISASAAGLYVLELTATDATGTSHPAKVQVRVS